MNFRYLHNWIFWRNFYLEYQICISARIWSDLIINYVTTLFAIYCLIYGILCVFERIDVLCFTHSYVNILLLWLGYYSNLFSKINTCVLFTLIIYTYEKSHYWEIGCKINPILRKTSAMVTQNSKIWSLVALAV